MKIKKIMLQNYKRFVKSRVIKFTDTDGNINDNTLIIGANGSGKTSILQAIVILLAKVIREDFNTENFDWSGFEYRNIQTGNLPLKIEAQIVFEDKELDTILEYAQELKNIGVNIGLPSKNKEVTIFFDYKTGKTIAKGEQGNYYQFSGYQYAKQLAKHKPNINKLFENVGNIYWYTEQRNSYNITNLLDNETTHLNDIRAFLSNAYSYHKAIEHGQREIREGQFDFYKKIKKLYETVFPDRTFIGSAPRFDIYEKAKAPDFFLYDNHYEYELSGMSAGERAIFPILMDFARWNINNSIIIIDELELHLHPPLQQTFVRALQKLGNNNQFIFTTHSNSIVSMFDESENQIIRMPNE